MNVKKEVLEEFGNYVKKAGEIPINIKLKDYNRVMVAGMGGSGIAGDIANIFIKDKPLFTVSRNKLPNFANSETLLIIVSYSGNTEEMISVYNEGKRKNCQIVCITSGGKIKEKCITDRTPYIKVPSDIAPRSAMPYLVIPLLRLLGVELELDKLINIVKNKSLFQKARDISQNLVDKIPIIYSSERLKPVAYRWKTQFNENAKIHAFSNSFSEMNHNELEGFVNLKGDYYVIIIRDEGDNVDMKKRMELAKDLIKSKGVSVTEISITGRNEFNRVMSEIYVGDLASVYLAEAYNTDPTSIHLIEDFKKKLKGGK